MPVVSEIILIMRQVRYQGAIIKDHHILLIQHRLHDGDAHWLFPGGGIEPDESEAECVAREMEEETGLEVAVGRLLFSFREPEYAGRIYTTLNTYLCTPIGGEARPGYEPEPEAAASYSIAAVGWFDLRGTERWPDEVQADTITFSQLQEVRQVLGYGIDSENRE